MKRTTLHNLQGYLLIAVLCGVAVCIGTAMAAGKLPGFGPGGFFEPVAEPVGTAVNGFAAAAALWLSANRPRLGDEEVFELLAEASHLDPAGALRTMLGQSDVEPLTDGEMDRLADRLFDKFAARVTLEEAKKHVASGVPGLPGESDTGGTLRAH